MVQEAIITKLLSNEMAEVAVVRASACGKSCSGCESCTFQNELKVTAHNKISALPGHKVLIESKTSSIFSAALVVYLLPMCFMIAGFIIASFASLSEAVCVAASFVGFFFGVAVILLYNRRKKLKKPISFSIIKELN